MTRSIPSTIGKVYGRQKDRYLELIQQFPLRKIKSDDELDVATRVIHSLIDQDQLSPAEHDYLDVISDLVEEYEDETDNFIPQYAQGLHDAGDYVFDKSPTQSKHRRNSTSIIGVL